jgi:hypothetical protein
MTRPGLTKASTVGRASNREKLAYKTVGTTLSIQGQAVNKRN